MPSSEQPEPEKAEEVPAKPLQARKAAFVRAFTSGPTLGNATRSAKAAGYKGTPHTLETTGCRLLRDDGVRREIARITKLIDDASIADAREVKQIMSKMVRGELSVPIGINEGVVVYGPPKASDRRGAGEYLAKVRGEMREGRDVVVTGKDGGPVEVALGWSAPVARAELERRVRERYPADKVDAVLELLLGVATDDAKESAA